MNFKELIKAMNLSNDLLNIFTDYAFILDRYFANEKNKEEHKELYDEYQVLNQNLKDLMEKYKL